MPPTSVHFNGSVNLADAETVMREIAERVPTGVRRVPDGETGDRQHWIAFQLARFWETPGLEQAGTGRPLEGYGEAPQVRLSEGSDPDAIDWPDVGYANAYTESYSVYRRLRDTGVIGPDMRFQVEYPTPLASLASWVVPEDQQRLEPSYERAMFDDLRQLLDVLPHDDIAVQWDVAVEFAILDGGFEGADRYPFDAVVQRLVRCVNQVPADVPVGLHLCYGDLRHEHFKEPESLEMQVRVANAVTAGADRTVAWFAFTVPQYQREAAYFEPLRELRASSDTELYFALVPYHPDRQPAGTTDEQIRLIDGLLGDRPWGVCTECGMARADREDIPVLLDLHHELLSRA
ncbi:MAG: hypothetical protein GEV07_22965 [Streptosporangiales bacterium]|nr:hypothetical protein [Streptosporangiales bacterium]